MDRKEKYILMCQIDEVFSFEVTFGDKNDVRLLGKVSHFDSAPYGIKKNIDSEKINNAVFRFFNCRTISPMRWEYEEILKNTGTENGFDLAFQGHGLSLFDHYWYKKEGEDLRYEDINFFTNKWDDSFARIVLSGDYFKLKNVDLNVPDIVNAGWGVKGWICEDDGPKLYKLGIVKDHFEEPLAEVLCSRLAKRMFHNNEFCEYQLKKINDKYSSCSKVIINVDEELVPLSIVIPTEIYDIYRQKNTNRDMNNLFFEKIKEVDIPGINDFFIKLACWRSLCFANDLHFDNLSAIRNIKTGEIRLAPVFDFGGAFGSGKTGRQLLENINKATYLIVYFAFGDLNPDWDYSWYDPHSLDGFEDEIRELLSKSDFYNPQLIDNIIDVFQHQKASLDENSKKKI